MTNEARNPRPSDYRRAAALMVHHHRRDSDGFDAILEELSDDVEIVGLLFALLHLQEVHLKPVGLEVDERGLEEYMTRAAAKGG